MKGKVREAVFLRFHYLIIAALVGLGYFIPENKHIITVFAVISAVYIVIFEICDFLKRRNAKQIAESIVSMLDMTSQKRIDDFPISLMVTAANGEILWYNERLIEVFGEEEILNLRNVRALNRSILSASVTEVEWNGRFFTVFDDNFVINSKELNILYFFDTTDFYELQKEHDSSRPVVAHILVDNYDDVFSHIKDIDKAQVVASIDEAVSKWAASSNGIIRRIERDRYLLIFEKRHLLSMADRRFDILDIVRKLDVGTKVSPTLSIGVGMSSGGFSANEDFAETAVDMALGRGGDQAVVKTDGGYEFFGGKTAGIEKRSKIKARVVASAISELFRARSSVIITGHKYSDMDSLASSVGISRIAKYFKKDVHIVIDEKNTMAGRLLEKLKKSGFFDGVFISPEEAKGFVTDDTVAVICDTHRPSVTEAYEEILAAGDIIVIDHHRKSSDAIDNVSIMFHDPSASSASEMVTELIQYIAEEDIVSCEAEALLAGIMLDTKSFTLRTSSATFDASSYLKKMGANTVNAKLLFQTDKETYVNKIQLMQKAVVYRGSAAIAVWDMPAAENMKLITAQAADDLLNVENIRAAFTVFEDASGINISARSFGEFNVQIIMEYLGGGGHQTMAATLIKGITVEKAVEELKKAIDRYIKEMNQ